ncbi:MAG: hypothetical protein ACE5K7_07455 [Phycisphaerae bacterium]
MPELPLLHLDQFRVAWGAHLKDFVERDCRLYWRARPEQEALLVDIRPGLFRPREPEFFRDTSVRMYKTLREELSGSAGAPCGPADPVDNP